MSNGILKKIFSVYLQINEINDLLAKSLKENETQINQPYYLINKDIVSFYLKFEELEQKYTKNKTLANLEEIMQTFLKDANINGNNKYEIPDNINMFLNDIEKLKIENKEFLYNFFIVKKEVLEILLDSSNKDNNEEDNNTINNAKIDGFALYNVSIGKEGIYIWNKNKKSDKVDKDDKENEEIVVNFLDVGKLETNLQNFRVKRLYIFKSEEVFNNELKNNILGKSIYEYIVSRNILTSKYCILNLIDNGNVIGEYINIMRRENFHDEGINKEDSSSNNGNNNNDNKDNNNSSNNKEIETKSRFDSFVENIEKNIDEFLTAFIVNCYYIKELREEIYKNNNKDKNDSLTSKLREFYVEFKKKNNIENQINNIITLIKNKFSEELSQFNSKKIINNLIIKVMNKIYEENESNKKILELFYGDKRFISKSTKDILFSSNLNEIKDLNDSNKLYYYSLPKILIINDNNSIMNTLQFHSYQYLNKYDLISCIQKAKSGFESIIIKENNYEKIIYSKDKKKYEFSDIQNTNLQDEIKNSVISIFKRKSTIEKREYNEILGETMRDIQISDFYESLKLNKK